MLDFMGEGHVTEDLKTIKYMCDEKKRVWQKCDSKLKMKSGGHLTKRRGKKA